MKTLNERLRDARKNLHLSQEYVSKEIGVNRTAIVEIESGKRKVSVDELAKFSELFQISVDELMNGKATEMPVQMFARSFGELGAYHSVIGRRQRSEYRISLHYFIFHIIRNQNENVNSMPEKESLTA